MTRKDKQRRQSLLKRLKKIGLNPAEEIISSRDYNEVVKSILEHMNNTGMRYDLYIIDIYCYFTFKSMSIQSLREIMVYVTEARNRV